MSSARRFTKFYANKINSVHVQYYCPYGKKQNLHGSCKCFTLSRVEGRSSHCETQNADIDIIINLNTIRNKLKKKEKNEWRRYRKNLMGSETKFFMDDYLAMMKFYARRWKKDNSYSKQRLELDWCKSGLSKYETRDMEGASINHERYIEDRIFSDIA